jgi:hypothetical protein
MKGGQYLSTRLHGITSQIFILILEYFIKPRMRDKLNRNIDHCVLRLAYNAEGSILFLYNRDICRVFPSNLF